MSKYIRPTQLLVVVLSGMSLFFVIYHKSLIIAMLGYDLNRNVSDSLIFTEFDRLSNSLLFSPARFCCADQIKLISSQRNDLNQEPNSGATLD